jgi:hypothetical protein
MLTNKAVKNPFIHVLAINCGFLFSLSKAKGDSFQLHWTHHIGVLDSLDSSGGLKQLQRRQRSSSPSFASAHELPEREIVEPRPSEDEMSGNAHLPVTGQT